MLPLPPGWIKVKEEVRPTVALVRWPPWKITSPDAPPVREEITEPRSSSVVDESLSWVPPATVSNGDGYLTRLMRAYDDHQWVSCSSLISEEGTCRVVALIGEEGGGAIGVCRAMSKPAHWLTSSCTAVALRVGNEYWLPTRVGPPTEKTQISACCGDTFRDNFPCRNQTVSKAIDAVKTTLARNPIAVSGTSDENIIRAVAAWRPSQFLGSSWREQFALTIQMLTVGNASSVAGYVIEIDYVIKNGAAAETEEMHLPNLKQKTVVYNLIRHTIESGIKAALCPN
jgi:hypothetical protein